MTIDDLRIELAALKKELAEKENLINKAERLSNQGSWKWDIKKDIWTFSKNWHIVHGVEHLSVNKETLMELAHPDDIPLINEAIRKAIEKKLPYDIEHRIIRQKDGEVRWVKVDGEVTFDEKGEPSYMFGLGQDITEEKLIKEVLKENETLLNKTGEIAKVGGWEIKKDMKHTSWTKEMYHIHEVPYDFVSTVDNGIEFYHPDDREMVKKAVNAAINHGSPFEFEARIITAKGNQKWVYAKGEVKLNHGKFHSLSGVFQDISERKAIEREKRETQEQLQQITDAIPGMIYQFVFHKDGSFSIPYANDRTSNLLGFSKSKMKSPDFLFSRIHPDDYESTMRSILKAKQDKAVWSKELRALNKRGKVVWLKGQSYGNLDKYGNVIHNGVLLNITKQKEAEEKLQKSQQQYQNIAENLPGAVIRYQLFPDGTDELLYISKGIEEIYEVSAKDAMKDNSLLWDNVYDDDLGGFLKSIQKSAEELSIWSYEYRIKLPGNRMKWISSKGSPKKQRDGSVIWDSIAIDITKQKEAEQALKELTAHLEDRVEERTKDILKVSEELNLYWEAANHANSGVWKLDLINDVLYWDDIMYRLYGIDKSRFSGAYNAWETSLHPLDKDRTVKELEQAIEGIKPLDTVFRIIHPENGKVSHIKAKGKVERNKNGKPTRVYGTNWDVTNEMKLAEEYKKALDELKATQNQLIQSEKMASLGTLTAGVAHELNNPLNYIVGAHSAISEHLKDDNTLIKEELKEYLSWIKSGTDRATQIVKGLNLFSRSNDNYDELCDLKKIINDCLLMLENKFKGRIDIELNLSSQANQVRGNYGKLHQAVLNVLSNAIDAIDKNGKIKITSQLVKGTLVLTFKDNGSGINKENLKKVLDPFFTTKEPGKGTGLGLYITHTIIEKHNGSIKLTSIPNKGTKVRLKLPKID